MKKILIIFPIPHQKELVASIQQYVSSSSLSFDYLDIKTWTLYSDEIELNHIFYSKFLCLKSNNWFINRILCSLQSYAHKILDGRLLKHVMMQYDIIDFHYYGDLYDELIPLVKNIGKKIKINLWGSDLLRLDDKRRRMQLRGYEVADIIVMSSQSMKFVFDSYFPQYSNKVRIQHFGNSRLSEFNNMDTLPINYNILKNYREGKIIVTCGYNGSRGQRHFEMINMLNNLPSNVKRQLHVVFPMTYGAIRNYYSEIIDKISDQEYSFDVLMERLSGIELFNLRRISDIVVNVQQTDALAGSIQEHIYCNNIMLLGDWLPYSIFKDAGIFYVPTSLEELSDNFLRIFNNIDKYKELSSSNRCKIMDLCSWEKVASKWYNIYQSI